MTRGEGLGAILIVAGALASAPGLLLVGAIVGPLLAGLLSDRYGRRRTLIVYYALCAAGVLAFLASGSNLALLIPLMLPFGLADSLSSTLDFPTVFKTFGLYGRHVVRELLQGKV